MGATTTSAPRAIETPASTLRLCWELVAARCSRGADPLRELRRDDVIAALGQLQRPGQQLRVAAVLEIGGPSAEQGGPDVDALAVALQETAAALASADIALDLWPQLAGADRFLNTRTARQYSLQLLPLLKAARDIDMGLFLDMEPTLATLEGAWTLTTRAPMWSKARGLSRVVTGVLSSVWDARQGSRDLAELARDLAAFSFPVVAAVPPPVLAHGFGSEAVNRFVLGCPDDDGADGALFGRTAALCYAPMLRRRGDDRAGQHRALVLWAARHRERSSAICLGPLSTGLLGDEPVYLAPEHLRQDLGAVRSLGFSDVTLYSAEGLLFGPAGDPDDGVRDDIAAWVDAVVGSAPAATSKPTTKQATTKTTTTKPRARATA